LAVRAGAATDPARGDGRDRRPGQLPARARPAPAVQRRAGARAGLARRAHARARPDPQRDPGGPQGLPERGRGPSPVSLTEPPALQGSVVLDEVVPARAPWTAVVRKGQTLRIVDLEGNQAVDFLMYALDDDAERYSAQDTIAAQGNIFLRTGSVLMSNEGRPMAQIASTTVAYHDTIGGACSCESNTLRYGFHTKSQHACVENFLLSNAQHGRSKRDIVSNINWFMNVPVESDGTLGIVDGISAAGLYVDLVMHMDVIAVISNCPQVNNPCNGFNPTPVRVLIASNNGSLMGAG